MVLASIPERFSNLKCSVPVLTKQCDELHIVVNKSLEYPDFLNEIDNVQVHPSLENRGSASRFFMTDKFDGYYLAVDDDIIYPEDYVSKMIAELQKHDDKALICVCGGTFNPYAKVPIWSTHRHRMFSRKLKPSRRVLLPGMGTCCFLTSYFKMLPKDFFGVNLSDISATVKAAKESVPIYSIERKDHWLRQLPVHNKALSHNRSRYDMMENIIKENREILQRAYDDIPVSDRR
jgi:hypothetical protein